MQKSAKLMGHITIAEISYISIITNKEVNPVLIY